MKPISVVIPRRKPRNPLVPAARLRHAGAHRRSGGGRRLQARQALHRELGDMRPHSP